MAKKGGRGKEATAGGLSNSLKCETTNGKKGGYEVERKKNLAKGTWGVPRIGLAMDKGGEYGR